MTVPSIDSLTRELTPQECLTALTNIMDVVGIPTTSWQEGSITRSEIESFADMVSYCSVQLSAIANAGFPATAAGPWLDIIAEYGGYDLQRETASFAQCTVQVTNATGGLYSAPLGTLIIRNANTAKEYANVSAISLANGTSQLYTFQAGEAGTGSNAAVGEITKLTSSVSGLSVANTSTAIAVDEESDDSLRDRIRLAVISENQFGPAEAYRFWARRATHLDGTNIGVTKVKTIAGADGTLRVIVASDVGGIPDDANNLDRVEASLRSEALTMGPSLVVESAIPQVIAGNVTVSIYSDANLSTSEVTTLVLNALSERIKRLPIGGDADGDADDNDDGVFYVSSFLAAVQSAHPSILRASSTTFTADLPIPYNSVAVIGSWAVTIDYRNRPSS